MIAVVGRGRRGEVGLRMTFEQVVRRRVVGGVGVGGTTGQEGVGIPIVMLRSSMD